jgi:catechol 2,3-dioxygenase-like lactoylglutathione lyase family enzyme
MQVKRVGFVGVRTDKVAEMTAFFRDVLGLEGKRTDEAWTVSRLPTGSTDFVEVFGEEFDDERLIPREVDGVFVAFFVDDLAAARSHAEAAGAVIVGEAFSWFFLRAPDGRIYCVQEASD